MKYWVGQFYLFGLNSSNLQMIERTTMPDAFIWEKRERKSDIIMDYGGGALLPRQTDSKLRRNADELFL